MARPWSAFSRAMLVNVTISKRALVVKSWSASRKSAATSSPWSSMMGVKRGKGQSTSQSSDAQQVVEISLFCCNGLLGEKMMMTSRGEQEIISLRSPATLQASRAMLLRKFSPAITSQIPSADLPTISTEMERKRIREDSDGQRSWLDGRSEVATRWMLECGGWNQRLLVVVGWRSAADRSNLKMADEREIFRLNSPLEVIHSVSEPPAASALL